MFGKYIGDYSSSKKSSVDHFTILMWYGSAPLDVAYAICIVFLVLPKKMTAGDNFSYESYAEVIQGA